ncbi:MAG: hypothetical protein LUD77_00790 [Clostridiales bacterium]|nr:hypothetical protein [Clostridiales bacterium]
MDEKTNLAPKRRRTDGRHNSKRHSEKDVRKTAKKDYEKKTRIKYYISLSGFLLIILACVAVGMFLYLRYEAQGYRNQYVAELQESMEESKNICIEVLESVEADQEYIDNINTQYNNAMLERDILQQYYLVDGIMDYSLTSLYYVVNIKRQEAAVNGGQWLNYDEEINTIIEAQAAMKTVKEQISSIDLDDYY